MAKSPKKPAPLVVEPLRARAVRPPGKRSVHWYWRVEVYEDGVARTVWAGRIDRQALNTKLAEMVVTGSWEHDDAPGEDAQHQEVRTVTDLLRAWMYVQERRQDLRPSSLESYKGHKRRLQASLGSTLLAVVDKRVLTNHANSRMKVGDGSSTVNQDLVILGMAWNWGREHGAVESTYPTVRINVKPSRSRVTPTPAEVAQVLPHLRPWVASAVRVMWSTGCRVGEVASLRIRDADTTSGWLRLTGKTGPRDFPYTNDLREVLEPWRADRHPDLWMWGRKPGTVRRAIITGLKAACYKADVRQFTSHGLRRAAVDRLARSGVDVATAAALLGHSPEVMLQHYRQVTPEDLSAAVRRAGLGRG